MTTRAALLGTAETWHECPWDDPGLTIISLNDAYQMRDPQGKGLQRIDEWYDIHPVDRMWFRPKDKHTFVEGEIPDDVFVRPEGHVEWLKDHAQTIPVWLHAAPPEGWSPNAQRFPFEEVKAFLQARPDQEAYISSSPEMILAHLILRGFTEIQIYGIHLSTQREYIEQRPGFEWLLGRAKAMGITLVLPPKCPLLKHGWVYGYEPRPKKPQAAAIRRQRKAEREFSTLALKLAKQPWWKSKADGLARLARLQAEMKDAQQAAKHAHVTGVGG